MSMFPHWFGTQKAATPKWEMLCLNCCRKFDGDEYPKKCPYCDSRKVIRDDEIAKDKQDVTK